MVRASTRKPVWIQEKQRNNRQRNNRSLQHDSFKKNARNRMWTSTWPLSTLPKHLTVSREGLWKIMAKFGCPAKFITKYIDRWCCQHYYTHAKLGRLPTACQKTEPFPYKLSRKLLKIKWQDRIPDTEVLKRAGMQSVQSYSSETGTVKMDRPS